MFKDWGRTKNLSSIAPDINVQDLWLNFIFNREAGIMLDLEGYQVRKVALDVGTHSLRNRAIDFRSILSRDEPTNRDRGHD